MKLSANDQAELDKFKRYLSALDKWEKENLANIGVGTAEMEVNKKRLRAQFDIYREIYGEEP